VFCPAFYGDVENEPLPVRLPDQDDPHLGDMLIPVAAYLFIILAMGISAALGTANHFLVIAGALLFILSDSLIAINRFLTPVPLSDFLIMITYYLAQFFITFGASKQGPEEAPQGN
jgi:uncharacterized membrane protein YhhN